jgi:homoserine kinase type II
MICLTCPNGCHLKVTSTDHRDIVVSGNRCDKGLAFVRSVLESRSMAPAGRITGQERTLAWSRDDIKEISLLWGIITDRIHPHLIPHGSPERALFRTVIEGGRHDLFVLEQIPAASFHSKMLIIKTLEFLHQKGMPRIVPYFPSSDGNYIQKHKDGFWQMARYLKGVPLHRETYYNEGWRAAPLAEFLIELNRKAQGLPFYHAFDSFSVRSYVERLVSQVERHQPAIYPDLQKVMAFLQRDFLGISDDLPAVFCHGDFHPLNVVWSKDDVLAVIDWEFQGVKLELYDVANMVGCLGVEDPDSLLNELVMGFVQRMRSSGIFSEDGWKFFLELVVALRFAWLSEWLRKDDKEMVVLELEYMALLIDHRAKLSQAWGVCPNATS